MTFDYNKYFPTEGEFSRAEIERIITLHDMPITDDLLKLARACFAEAKIKSDKTYDGWSNYETWRVNIEIFKWMTLADVNTVEVDPHEVGEYLKDHVEELTFSGYDERRLSTIFARAFLSEVNYSEIASRMIAKSAEVKA
jgi:hypothetical protein